MRYIEDPDFNQEAALARIGKLIKRYGVDSTLSGRMLFRPRVSPPPQVYKYTSVANALLSLNGLTLRYTQSEVLDDVFEEAPHRDEIRRLMPSFEDGPTIVVDIYDPKERLDMFDRVRRKRARMRRSGVILSDDNPIITSHGLHKNWKYELGNKPFKEVLEVMIKPLALSLTELSNNVLMWSGYGNEHRGVRLGFDTRHRYFRSNRDLIGSSGYFAPIEYRDLTVEDYAYRFAHERFFIKTRDWSHQREWRRIEISNMSAQADWRSALCLFPFPPEALTSIVFGARCAGSDIHDVMSVVRANSQLRHITFQKVKMSLGELLMEDLSLELK